MQTANRFLDFAQQILKKHQGFGVDYAYEPAAMLHLEDEMQEASEQTPITQNVITNLYHIQNVKEENYLFKQNLTFLTQILENKMYQNLYPSVEKQIQKVIREELPQSEEKIISSVSEQLVRLVQKGGLKQFEMLKEKILLAQQETTNINFKEQEVLFRKIENIWNSSVYHNYLQNQQSNVLNQTIMIAEKSSKELVRVENEKTKELQSRTVMLERMVQLLNDQEKILTSSRGQSVGNLGRISLEYMQEQLPGESVNVQKETILQHDMVQQNSVQKSVQNSSVYQNTMQQKQVQKQVQHNVVNEGDVYANSVHQSNVHQSNMQQSTVQQSTVQQSDVYQSNVHQSNVQQNTVQYQKELEKEIKEKQSVQEFGERMQILQEQIVKQQETEIQKMQGPESINLEYMQEETVVQSQEQHQSSPVYQNTVQQKQAQKQDQHNVVNEGDVYANSVHQSNIHQSTMHQNNEEHSTIHQSTMHQNNEEHSTIHQSNVHQSNVQQTIEQQEHLQNIEQDIAQDIVQENTVQYQKELEKEIKEKQSVQEFRERMQVLQEQIVKQQETEIQKVQRPESITLEYMQEETMVQSQEHHQSNVQQTIEQQEHLQNIVQDIAQDIVQENTVQYQKELEKEIKEKQPVQEFRERMQVLQEQIVKQQETEIQKVQRPESITLEYMQEEMMVQSQERHQSNVQQTIEQQEYQQNIVQDIAQDIAQDIVQENTVQYQKELEKEIKEKQPVQEFRERMQVLQEQIVKQQETEIQKVQRPESITLEYMQEETMVQSQEHHQSNVQQTIEQQEYQQEYQQNIVQNIVQDIAQDIVQENTVQYQKELEKEIKEKEPVQEFRERMQILQEQIVKQQETEIQKVQGPESISLEYMQENRFTEEILQKNRLVKNTYLEKLVSVRPVNFEQMVLEYPTEEETQVHQQMIQLVQAEMQRIPQVPKVVETEETVLEQRTKILEKTKNLSEQILVRMETMGLVPAAKVKTAAKTVAVHQLSKVLLEHVNSEVTTEELQDSMVKILYNYQTKTVTQERERKSSPQFVNVLKSKFKAPEFVQQMEPAPIYYRSEDQISPEQEERNKSLEKKVHEVVKNLKTIEEKTIVHKERIIEQQKEVVHEILKNHSTDYLMGKDGAGYIRGEVQQSVEEQMNQNVGKIVDKVYRQLESKLKSERGRRGLI